MPFEFQETKLAGVFVVSSQALTDNRGSFAELFKKDTFAEIHAGNPLTQINWSRSKKNVLRGMHYQLPPKAQSKLVACVAGEIFDVAVDIRKGSPTYGQWVGQILSAESKTMLYIPQGFAHGFCVTSEEAEVIYFCDEQYSPENEGGLVWNDVEVAISWPRENPILAERDLAFPPLAAVKNTFTL
ncbi:MAG: dTDP-4-dehydrorhamnose 3,5-epimerase [Candidatus Andersenbacteria bacterium]|nr:dTDP-4-dehydrorhamnose 3,5-epimerase [Candidatus Andersenbacteria bacterium]MBI3251085.1 dTDP-4-dehydrorhamnose 3,5-epimerase [Candidatus Andersenbacteria bacterium]